jgi:hypothetical protein
LVLILLGRIKSMPLSFPKPASISPGPAILTFCFQFSLIALSVDN